MIDASVIEKIRKLRAITEARGATEDEAIAAQQRMFTLLAKYNLELSEIPDDDNSKPADPLESDYGAEERKVWKRTLHGAVASLNFSFCLTCAGRIVVVGTRANIIATREMAGYLCDTVERLADAAARNVPGEQRRRYRNSFEAGCSNRLYWRIKDLEAQARAGQMKSDDPDSLLPALANVYNVAKARTDAYVSERFPNLRKSSARSRASDYDGYHAGERAGDSLSLNRQVGVRRSGLLN